MATLPKWLKEFQGYIDSLEDYAEISPKIKRLKGKVVEVTVDSTETHAVSREEALTELKTLLDSLEKNANTGLLHIVFDLKNGIIKTIGYKNTKTTRY